MFFLTHFDDSNFCISRKEIYLNFLFKPIFLISSCFNLTQFQFDAILHHCTIITELNFLIPSIYWLSYSVVSTIFLILMHIKMVRKHNQFNFNYYSFSSHMIIFTFGLIPLKKIWTPFCYRLNSTSIVLQQG